MKNEKASFSIDNGCGQFTIQPSASGALSISLLPERVYRCDAGHEIKCNGTWTSFVFQAGGESHDYNYCMRCFGEWAVKNFPLREVV